MHSHSTKSHCALLLAVLLIAGCSSEQDPAGAIARTSEPPSPAPLQISPVLPNGSGSPTQLAQKGERVAWLLGCSDCHGKDLHGKNWIDEPEFAVLYTSNLTRTLPSYTDAQLERAIREGVRHDESDLWEMPSNYFLPLSSPDMLALIAYLRSVPQGGNEHPRMVLGPEGEKEIREESFTPAAYAVKMTRNIAPVFAGEENAWGRYLTQTICSECHGPDLSGNSKIPNLTVAASYSLTDFKTLMKTGQPTGDRKLEMMSDVAQTRFSHLTEPEISAIHAYLVARAAMPR